MLAAPNTFVVVIVGIVLFISLVFIIFISRFFLLWLQAKAAHADVRMMSLIGMSLRKVNLRVIVLSKIRAVQAGLKVGTGEMESHYRARAECYHGPDSRQPGEYRVDLADRDRDRPGRQGHT